MVTNNPPPPPPRTISAYLKPLNTKRTTTYGFGYYGHGLEQAYKYGGVKPINGIPSNLDYFLNIY